MTHFRAFRTALFTFLLATTAAFAGGAKNDPKGEPRKDPKEQRESVARSQSELRSLKLEQILLRLQAQGMTREQAIDALKARLAKRQGEQADEAAGALGKAKQPAKVKPVVRQKILAKVAGGKNPHDVQANTVDRGGKEDPGDEAFRSVESGLRDEPIMHDFWASRGKNQDYGSDVVSRYRRDEREGKSEKSLANAELKKLGDQPEVGYFIRQKAEDRREALLSFNCEGSLENIRRWRRIAVLDPDASVRLAASDRLRRAGEALAERFLLKLDYRERRLLGNLDPYDSTTRDFLRSLWDRDDLGNESMRRMAIEMLNAFPMNEDWVQEIQAGRDPKIAPANKLDIDFDNKPVAAESEADLAHQATLEPKWPILYNPKANVVARLDAMKDRSVDNTPANMKDWIYVVLNDANEKVREEAEKRAKFFPEAESLIEQLRSMREEMPPPAAPQAAVEEQARNSPRQPEVEGSVSIGTPYVSNGGVRPLTEAESSRLHAKVQYYMSIHGYRYDPKTLWSFFYEPHAVNGRNMVRNPRDPSYRQMLEDALFRSRHSGDITLELFLNEIIGEFGQ